MKHVKKTETFFYPPHPLTEGAGFKSHQGINRKHVILIFPIVCKGFIAPYGSSSCRVKVRFYVPSPTLIIKKK